MLNRMFSSLFMKIERNMEVLFFKKTIVYKVPLGDEKVDIGKLVKVNVTRGNIEVVFTTKQKTPELK